MVFVKVRETYDLHTVKNKLSLISIHTPKSDIIKANYPGLLMQCKMYRPVSCDVRVACASILPADPLQVSTADGDIAPEDLFNPILYKACTNQGMSQIEAYMAYFTGTPQNAEVNGNSAAVDINPSIAASGSTALDDHFGIYYGLLSDTHSWRHASPQSGLEMVNLRPLVYEVLATVGDNKPYTNNVDLGANVNAPALNNSGLVNNFAGYRFKGNPKPMPMINCTGYTANTNWAGFGGASDAVNSEQDVPAPQICVGCIIVPPSRLHELYYRMVVEWTLEFSQIRSMNEITNMAGLVALGDVSHYQTYDYSAAKEIAGVTDSALVNDTQLVSSSVDINKVM